MVLAVGDIHGKKEKFFNSDFTPKYDLKGFSKIIFIGDYWDSFNKSFQEQKEVFLKIIELKKAYPEKFILLLGNHDAHYLYVDDMRLRCSGFQEKHASEIHFLMKDNVKLFDYFYFSEINQQTYIFSHAGVCGQFEKIIDHKYGLKYNEYDYIKVRQETKEFFYISKNNGGYDSFDGPLWLRPNELKNDMPSFSGDIIQIFGHTYNEKMQIFESDDLSFVNIDCDENLLINDNNIKTI